MENKTKICLGCCEEKPLTDFYLKQKKYVASRCKVCEKAQFKINHATWSKEKKAQRREARRQRVALMPSEMRDELRRRSRENARKRSKK